MSQKEKHILAMYLKAIRNAPKQHSGASVGEVAEYLGVSRNTAKKYLFQLVNTGLISVQRWDPINGVNQHLFWPN